ncbi:4-hydroxythreonine-4-phosphate dehydrogenase PdxA [Acetobacteraceae bacterium]|nr:4-hydroxythreonine-4-phosphate dehydrogenase PdxA [Acetobacteraceae bacterium]
MQQRPLAVTMGDPAGIGPEIIAKTWLSRKACKTPPFIVFGDSAYFSKAVPVKEIKTPEEGMKFFGEALPIFPVSCAYPPKVTIPEIENAPSVVEAIRSAVQWCLEGKASAVVTAPISKDILAQKGFAFPGHTEYLAHLCGSVGKETMMLACPELRVVLATVHVSIRKALKQLTQERIITTARKTNQALKQDFGFSHPRIAIAALNPHAGENGRMGEEEQAFIIPAVKILQEEGIQVQGPYPPDTLFTPEMRKKYDVALCMYHDQGLIPLKTLGMEKGVNITLGLPIIRTSPDHGTAFDIACDLENLAQSKASAESFYAALIEAEKIRKQRSKIVL